jgi:ketosteroid isomerase-like protein
MIKKKFYWFALGISVTLTACSTQQIINKEKIAAQTKAANDASLQGHMDKNADKICEVYSENAIILPPGGIRPIESKSAIKNYYMAGFNGGSVLGISTRDRKLDIIDDSNAYEIGHYTIHYKADTALHPIDITGTMLIIWKKTRDGKWKIKYDMWH